ncbi:MAG TPA: cytochrome c oxidase assembly protein [Acidimicrobiales bacterium]|nr:cytochrome c oxidase assembly protein [Acidimicrobiales bacterium]
MSFSWAHPHFSPAPVLVALALLAWYLEATRRCEPPATRQQKRAFYLGLLALLTATSWPLAELAHTTSLLILVLQRELLILAVAPLLLFALPPEVGIRLTQPRAIDWMVVRLSEPALAVMVTTALLTVTAMPFSVSAASQHSWIRWLVEIGTLAAGFVLWNPVIRRVPGVRQLTPIGTAGYLLAQSVAMSFLSFAWILAPHLLYPSLQGQRAALGVSPLLDQRLSGWVAKLGTFGVLWPVAYRCFSRSIESGVPEAATLQWRDVERQLERIQRQERKPKNRQLAPPFRQ